MDTGWVNILFAKSLAIGDILSWFSFISYSVYCIKKLWNKYFLNIANTLKVITYFYLPGIQCQHYIIQNKSLADKKKNCSILLDLFL